MVQSTSCIVLAALLISSFSYCSAVNIHCVTPILPTANSCSSCPHTSSHCATLSEYAQEAESYFTSNTTMVFLPGDHALDMDITVANITGLTMHGEFSSSSVATILCNPSVGFMFISVVNIRIHSLAFTSCNRTHSNIPQYANFIQTFLHSTQFQSVSSALFFYYTQYTELVNCSFHDNFGTALAVINTNTTLENNEFIHNKCASVDATCVVGGGITAIGSNLRFIGDTTFVENNAFFAGAGILMFNSSLGSTGSIHFINNSNTCHYDYNSHFFWTSFCGTICALASLLHFTGTSHFIGNSAEFGGAINTMDSVLKINGTSNFSNNLAIQGGAIFAFNTAVTFNGSLSFTNNGNYTSKSNLNRGGGVFLSKSTFFILPNTTMYWEGNHANYGGAIYVDDQYTPTIYCTTINTCEAKNDCFFQLPGQNLSKVIDAQLVFKSNSADTTGSVLYGGGIDNCKLIGLDSYSSGEVFDMLVHIENDSSLSSISSYPYQVCPCENNHPDCSKSNIMYSVYPGETFHISVVAFGQRNGTALTAVRSRIQYAGGSLQDFQYTQLAQNTCTAFNYTVFSLSKVVKLELYADGPCSTFGESLGLWLNINQTCPPGFSLSEPMRSCVCEQRLEKYTNNCRVVNGLGHITRSSSQHFWVGYDNQSHGLILSPHCPFDYCVSQTVEFPLNNTDLQCAYNRSGLLCGACRKDYSLVLGTSQCKQCTNSHLVLLIPFAVMGVALVFFLLVCKLTVATGTLSGLLFYANMVGVNRTIFLPVESTNICSIFIAWLNLDFGIETCFYNGMDAYSKTWLQFVFPVYIWVIVGVMIFLSNFSPRFANLLGSNPVSVLATLILLSYTKVLRTLITVIYSINLEYPLYNYRNVWVYDANLDYLRGKHIPLFIVAVFVFLFLFLPYTLLLLFDQWLQVISHLRLFSWRNSARLKPFMDSYHAPYKAKHRYWPGLLLVFRLVLLLVFAFNPQQIPSINLLAIIVGTVMLIIWAWVSGGVYSNWCLDALEGSFALNVVIVCAVTYHVKLTKGNQLVVGYTSVICALITFVGILVFQLAHVTGITQYLKRKCKALKCTILVGPNQAKAEVKSHITTLPDRLINPEEYEPPHTTQGSTIAVLTDNEESVHDVQRRLIPELVNTYGSID